ncbi:MAG: endonuclease/exonuclease/phosphatase family protein, partial [Acidobacteria bacterium]|nr:endonuclease/exonuclease/phosphatase family protein [Acidobacteriota bacterium]
MSKIVLRLRIGTYNIHRCRGLDQRVLPARIARVLQEIDADIVALQEVVNASESSARHGQACYLAQTLGYECRFGPTRQLRGRPYGNAVLSRFPIQLSQSYDLSCKTLEPRACFRADVALGERQRFHIFNVHLGTSHWERQIQARALVSPQILYSPELTQPRIMLGDFNDWMQGPVSRLLANHLVSADLTAHLRRCRTYPGFLPLVHLDHIYFESSLR